MPLNKNEKVLSLKYSLFYQIKHWKNKIKKTIETNKKIIFKMNLTWKGNKNLIPTRWWCEDLVFW